MAACMGHREFVFYLADTTDCSRDDKAEAFEVLGVDRLEKGETDECLELWSRAMRERHAPNKPVAAKRLPDSTEAALGHAVEVQTPSELNTLRMVRDMKQLHTQAILVMERVMGKASKDTNNFIEYIAAVRADDKDLENACKLLDHILDNLANSHPFLQRTVDTYALFSAFLKEVLKGSSSSPSRVLSDVVKTLKRAVSDLKRGDTMAKDKTITSDKLTSNRHRMLKIILHLIALAEQAGAQGNAGDKTELDNVVRQFVQMKLKGEKESPLLHMAVDEATTDIRGDWKVEEFPSLNVVRALLRARCDITAKNEAGQTALQFLHSEGKGDHSDIVTTLVAAAVH